MKYSKRILAKNMKKCQELEFFPFFLYLCALTFTMKRE